MEGKAPVGVRRAGERELPRVAEVLARAFGEDPAWEHLLPDVATRQGRLLAFFRFELAHLPAGNEAWMTDDRSGAAVWAEPGRWRASSMHFLRSAPAMTRTFGRRLPLAARAQMRNERLHPDEESH